ncbi:MAG: hypothetical protein MRECE_2c085 [Mycoplasmataceae bacterium CE_OT135]|nr:MAG: hypothetical protein MRECE_2c085 [Mycoplasmataceae bacterium CE_OT135]
MGLKCRWKGVVWQLFRSQKKGYETFTESKV